MSQSVDFTDPGFIADPYPGLATLRAEGRPVWSEELGMFLAATHRDANEVLRTRSLGRIFQPKTPADEWDTFNYLHADSILDSEPPKHTRLRSLITKAFNPRRIEQLRPTVASIVTRLLDQMEERGHRGDADLIEDFAEPLPVKVIASLLGFPEEDEHLLRPWSQAIVKMYEVAPDEATRAEARLAADEFAAYVEGLMSERKVQPGDDLISELAAVEDGGDRLSARELIATCVLLLNAGHEASVNGFGNGMVALLRRDEQRQLLWSSPEEHSATAVEEFVRFDAPLHLFERTATADTEIGGVVVKSGQKIAALLGSANRDESVFDRAHVMDITRDPNPHIGFGAGIHFCIGAPLARMEMQTALPMLVKRFPRLNLASEPVSRGTFVLRGYARVPVTID
ncbi:MAG: cytochrome P450 [Pontimonas sp.]